MDIIGKKFGMLTVIEESRRDKNYNIYYKCRCDCGFLHEVRRDNLLSGKVTSCGCHRHRRGLQAARRGV